jgi:hypothetical protein
VTLLLLKTFSLSLLSLFSLRYQYKDETLFFKKHMMRFLKSPCVSAVACCCHLKKEGQWFPQMPPSCVTHSEAPLLLLFSLPPVCVYVRQEEWEKTKIRYCMRGVSFLSNTHTMRMRLLCLALSLLKTAFSLQDDGYYCRACTTFMEVLFYTFPCSPSLSFDQNAQTHET